MKCSEITLRQAINMTEIFCPVKIIFNDQILYNDYDSTEPIEGTEEIYGEILSPQLAIPPRTKDFKDAIIIDINIEIVDHHHSIIILKGE